MYLDEYRDFCLGLKGVVETTPFGDQTLVFKVIDKMFALTGIDTFASINLKCDPEYAIELREKHDFIKPGFHMNKKHWNSLYDPSMMDECLVKELTKHSYDLVVSKMTKKKQQELEGM